MKSKYNYRTAFLACGSLLAMTSVHAQLTWDANGATAGQTNGAGAWLGANQWWNGATNQDWVSGQDAIFGGAATAGGAVTLASPTAVGSLSFNQFTGTYTLGTAGQALTINGGINKTSTSGIVSIISPVTLGGTQTWTNNSASALSVTGALDTGAIASPSNYTLTFDGTGNTNVTGVISGTGALVKNGTGRVAFGASSNANTYTGTTTINGGILSIANNSASLGSGNLTLNGGVLGFYWGAGLTRTLGTGNNQVQILGGNSGFGGDGATGPTINLGTTVKWGTVGEGATGFFNPGKFVLGSSDTSNTGITTFSSGIDLNGATRTILATKGLSSAGNRSTISGAISNSTGTAGLTKEGNGMLFLTNNTSSWNGATTVSEGLLDMGGINIANIGGGSGRNITVTSGAALRFNALSNAILSRIVETTNEIGIMSGATGNSLDFSGGSGANLSNAFLGNYASNGAKAEMSGTITPGSDGYKFGALGSSGNLGIRGAVTGANTLTVGQTGGSGIRVTLAGAKDFTGQTVINSGAKLTLGDNLALQNSALNVGSAGGNIAFNGGTAAATITGNTVASSPTFGGLIGSRNLSSVFTTAGGNNESNLTANNVSGFTLNVGTGNKFTYSGAIGGFGTGTSNNAGGGINGNSTLTKTGAGTQVLTGVSTYSGATNVNEGTLEIGGAGSINNSAVTVNGGTFSVNSSIAYSGALTFTTGTIGGTNLTGSLGALSIGLGQTVSPGNSPGLAATVNQTWASEGTYLWEINNVTGTAGNDPGWDLISGSGTLDIAATNALKFKIMITSLGLDNNAGDAVNFSDSTSYNWMIADFATLTGFSADKFDLDTTNFSNAFTGNFGIALGDTGSIGGSANQLFLTYTAVIPEPSVALLGCFGALLILRRRRA